MIRQLDINILGNFNLLDTPEFVEQVTKQLKNSDSEDAPKGSIQIISIRPNGYRNWPFTVTFEESKEIEND